MTYFKEHVTLSQENIEEFWQVSFRESSLYPVQKVKMPERCLVARCSNVFNPKKGISMHKIPFFGSTNSTAQRRRKRWVDFVLSKRKDWTPGKTSSLCSLHFREDDFNFRLDSDLKHSLGSDDIATCVFPTIHAKEESEEPPSNSGEKRMVTHTNAWPTQTQPTQMRENLPITTCLWLFYKWQGFRLLSDICTELHT